ncbi:MAG: cysteine--tRNA ligase [Deltaproteobacteria bacterium]|nr:cysteine--tRNA ligase [Deltaproteobacteria bacterium]
MIRLYDTAKRDKVDFHPLEAGKAGIYVCGPTVYDFCHIGHARCYVAFDTIVRTLREAGHETTYVRNITDIDDKIINRGRETGEDPLALSARFAEEFHHDMELLGNAPADVEPKVSDHLSQIVTMVERLIAEGHAYEVDGDVYYEVNSLPTYGALSGRNLDDLRAGARVDIDTRKRSPLDFALWKASKPNEPSWDSPWGKGRPGWHIECSAMSGAYLGETFDIHGGGMDLIFPHHENEIAQSQGCYGQGTFARHWLHNGFINIRTSEAEEEKMSKSLDNFFTIREVCRVHEPEALRLFLLGTHYRKPINFEIDQHGDAVSFPGLEEAERRLAYFYRTLSRLDDALAVGKNADETGEIISPLDTFDKRLHAALHDDFNTAAALGQVAELFTATNKLLDQPKAAPKAVRRRSLQRARSFVEMIRKTLGLFQSSPSDFLARRRDKLCEKRGLVPAEIDALITQRKEARTARDFAAADALRDKLVELGVELMDRPQGTDWAVLEE